MSPACCIWTLLFSAFFSPPFLLVIFLFLLTLRQDIRRNWSQYTNSYSFGNQPQPKSTCWMPSALQLRRSIALSENLLRMGGGINPAQNAIHLRVTSKTIRRERFNTSAKAQTWRHAASYRSILKSWEDSAPFGANNNTLALIHTY